MPRRLSWTSPPARASSACQNAVRSNGAALTIFGARIRGYQAPHVEGGARGEQQGRLLRQRLADRVRRTANGIDGPALDEIEVEPAAVVPKPAALVVQEDGGGTGAGPAPRRHLGRAVRYARAPPGHQAGGLDINANICALRRRAGDRHGAAGAHRPDDERLPDRPRVRNRPVDLRVADQDGDPGATLSAAERSRAGAPAAPRHPGAPCGTG